MIFIGRSNELSILIEKLHTKFMPMNDSSSFEVHGDNYLSRFHRGSDGLIWFERDHNHAVAHSQIDVFGQFWSLAVLKPHQKVGIRRRGHVIERDGPTACFIPPFSIVEWHLNSGPLKFNVYMGRGPLPIDMPQSAFSFLWTLEAAPTTIPEIFSLVRQATQTVLIGKEEGCSAVATRTKKLIDETFNEDLSISDIGKQLGYSNPSMTRAFRKCYGLPPIAYRNKLRIFESMFVMAANGRSVMATASEVGFKDLSRFNKNFRRQIRAVPSKFRAPWKSS